MTHDLARVLRDCEKAFADLPREEQCRVALQAGWLFAKFTRAVGYHSIGDDIRKLRDTLRTLAKAEEMR